MNLPSNPFMLLSYINTKLRDEYNSLDELVSSLDLSKEEIINKLKEIDYEYNESLNQFK